MSPLIDVSLLALRTKHGAKRMKPEANRARSSDDRAAIAGPFLKIDPPARSSLVKTRRRLVVVFR